MLRSRITRRHLLKKSALASTALLAAPYVRGAHAAGSLSIGFWDHWVPGGNEASRKICEEWAEKNKVNISIDYITSQGMKNLLTIAAEDSPVKAGEPVRVSHRIEPSAKTSARSSISSVSPRACSGAM